MQTSFTNRPSAEGFNAKGILAAMVSFSPEDSFGRDLGGGILFTILFMLSACSISAQDIYYVRFTDKNNNSCSITAPEAFLSPRAIERRRAQHIPIDTYDLPLTDSYVNALLPPAGRLVYKLKWDNAIILKSADTSFAAWAKQFSFVKSISKISGVS